MSIQTLLFPDTTGWTNKQFDAHDTKLDRWFSGIRQGLDEQGWEKQAQHKWHRVFVLKRVPLNHDETKFAFFQFVERKLSMIRGRDEVGYHHCWLYREVGDETQHGHVEERRLTSQILSQLFGTLFRREGRALI